MRHWGLRELQKINCPINFWNHNDFPSPNPHSVGAPSPPASKTMGYFFIWKSLMSIIYDDINQLERFMDGGANDIIQVSPTVLVYCCKHICKLQM